MNEPAPHSGSSPTLSAAQVRRYARHVSIAGFGVPAQVALLSSRVLVIGAGGLGAPVLMYLAAAGVGHIAVIDDDVVEESNLQRQVIHDTTTLRQPKVDSACARMRAINPDIVVQPFHERLTAERAVDLFGDFDLIIDGTDNFPTRYLVADAAEAVGVPVVWGSILRWHGQVSVFWPGRGPLLRDLFPTPPAPGQVPSCAEAGVVGALCGCVGSAMATEAIKVLTGVGEPLLGRVGIFDAERGEWHYLRFKADSGRVASTVEQVLTRHAQPDTGAQCEVETMSSQQDLEISADAIGDVQQWQVLDVREDFERLGGHVPGDRHVPLQQLMGASSAPPWAIEDATPVLVYCAHGVRSARAATWLRAHGVAATSLTGGWEAWLHHGGPVTVPRNVPLNGAQGS